MAAAAVVWGVMRRIDCGDAALRRTTPGGLRWELRCPMRCAKLSAMVPPPLRPELPCSSSVHHGGKTQHPRSRKTLLPDHHRETPTVSQLYGNGLAIGNPCKSAFVTPHAFAPSHVDLSYVACDVQLDTGVTLRSIPCKWHVNHTPTPSPHVQPEARPLIRRHFHPNPVAAGWTLIKVV